MQKNTSKCNFQRDLEPNAPIPSHVPEDPILVLMDIRETLSSLGIIYKNFPFLSLDEEIQFYRSALKRAGLSKDLIP